MMRVDPLLFRQSGLPHVNFIRLYDKKSARDGPGSIPGWQSKIANDLQMANMNAIHMLHRTQPIILISIHVAIPANSSLQ